MSGVIDSALNSGDTQFVFAEQPSIRQSSEAVSDNGHVLQGHLPAAAPLPRRTADLRIKYCAWQNRQQQRPPCNSMTPNAPLQVIYDPMTVQGPSADAVPHWPILGPLPSSPSDRSTTTETTGSSPSTHSAARSPSPGEGEPHQQVDKRQLSIKPRSPCFTTEPLAPSPRSSMPLLPKATSRRERRANRKAAPYTTAPLEKKPKEQPISAELEAVYTALVDEAMKDPANKYYRREAVERAIRGDDYRPKPKAKKPRPYIPSDRSRSKKSRKADNTPTETATSNYESPQRSGHDPVEHLPQQQVAEELSLVHRPTPFERIDNRGHLVSGIAPWVAPSHANPVSPVPSALFMTEQGEECNAFGYPTYPWPDAAESTGFTPSFDNSGHPFDLATPSMAPSYPLDQPNPSLGDSSQPWIDPLFDLFGNFGDMYPASTNQPWGMSTSPFAGLPALAGTSWQQ
ncbi:hypothetical protein NMY22_g440 [Coprinellus aureogranulatus]|nr:hypothetical protein NMY22_g440 [Coprinellus aureogranulatus]